MSFINALVLTTAINVGASTSTVEMDSIEHVRGGDERDAMRALVKATYKYKKIDKLVKIFEKKYISKEFMLYGGWVSGTAKIITEKKISYEWSF